MWPLLEKGTTLYVPGVSCTPAPRMQARGLACLLLLVVTCLAPLGMTPRTMRLPFWPHRRT